MKYWLLKSEPTVFSFQDLLKAKGRTTHWEGVRNYQARNLLKEIKKGDLAFFYHSNTEVPSIEGIAEIIKEAYPDAAALDPKSDYYDERAKTKNHWVVVEVKAIQKMKTPVGRPSLVNEPSLKGMVLMKKGTRLSVQPITEKEWKTICGLGHPEAL